MLDTGKIIFVLNYESSTWNPWLRATSIILFRVIPGRIVPFIAGVEIVLP